MVVNIIVTLMSTLNCHPVNAGFKKYVKTPKITPTITNIPIEIKRVFIFPPKK